MFFPGPFVLRAVFFGWLLSLNYFTRALDPDREYILTPDSLEWSYQAMQVDALELKQQTGEKYRIVEHEGDHLGGFQAWRAEGFGAGYIMESDRFLNDTF